MFTLFEKYLSSGMFYEALMIGQNLFNKNNSNKEIFEKYFNLLISFAADSEKTIDERNAFLSQAVTVLDFFCENVELNENIIEYISNKRYELNNASDNIKAKEYELQKNFLKKKIEYHDNTLAIIEKLILKLESVEKTTEFEKVINQIGKVDTTFEKEYLTERQQERYTVLTKKCSEIVDKKTHEFEHNKNVDYNLKAIEAYEKIFVLFKDNIIPDDHMDIIKGLFAFDTSKLFNETLVYYNYVYSYVLNKIDDNGKFLLTRCAIISEKRR